MVHQYKFPSFTTEYLETVKWTVFRDQWRDSTVLPTNSEKELYELFKHVTKRTVAGMERKYPSEQ